jgi:hypothetical protein
LRREFGRAIRAVHPVLRGISITPSPCARGRKIYMILVTTPSDPSPADRSRCSRYRSQVEGGVD